MERGLGWKTGFEPATSGSTNQRSNQLSYNHHLGLLIQVFLDSTAKVMFRSFLSNTQSCNFLENFKRCPFCSS